VGVSCSHETAARAAIMIARSWCGGARTALALPTCRACPCIDRAADAAEPDLAVDELDPSRGRAGGVPRLDFRRPQRERWAVEFFGRDRSRVGRGQAGAAGGNQTVGYAARLRRLPPETAVALVGYGRLT